MKKRLQMIRGKLITLLAVLAIAASCAEQAPKEGEQETTGSKSPLNVVATTTILGDVVRVVGGEQIELKVIFPAGADPHAYQITPRDAAALSDADLVFINGLGLETSIEQLFNNVRDESRIITVSDGINTLRSTDSEHDGDLGVDPHVWFDPSNVSIWTSNIEAALTEADPENQDAFSSNAQSYREQLKELDEWIADRFDQLPEVKRILVTDHDSLGYLVDRYGLELIGTVVPGFSTQAQPSAKEMAALLDLVRQSGVKAVFTSDSANTSLAEQIANDSGIRLIPLNTGSLTQPTGEAPTYLEFMRFNIETITNALSSDS